MKMMNTFLLKNNNSSFDNYAMAMKKKRFGNIAGSSFKRSKDELSNGDPMSISGVGEIEDNSTLKINQLIPQARDGHSSVVHENTLIIFGGDRHHMPFNDLFMLDLDDYLFDPAAE